MFGKQECVVGRKYTTILFGLYGRKIYYDLIVFLFNSSRDWVKDLAGSSRVNYVTWWGEIRDDFEQYTIEIGQGNRSIRM